MSNKLYFTKYSTYDFSDANNLQESLQEALDGADNGEQVYECTPKLIGHVKEPDNENTLEPIKKVKNQKKK